MPIIDNKEMTLLEELKNALSTSNAVDIFTGFFFFSGFSEMADLIADKKLRIVVGMDLDPKMIRAKRLTDESDLTRLRLPEAPLTAGAKIQNYRDSFIALFENSDVFDKERTSNAIEIFFNKIKDGSLEIRMNLNKQHGKFYLVYNKPELSHNGAFPGTRFMGSSNFTLSGLKGQGEINDSSREKDDFKKYAKLFEEAWTDSVSVPVVDEYNSREFIDHVKKATSLYDDPSPYIAYLRILKEEFSRPDSKEFKMPKELTSNRYGNLEYQADAIKDAIEKLKLYNGVLIADVVGLGKSIIASCVAANLNKKTIIITPPHLEKQWKDYAYEFGLTARVYTSGTIAKAVEENNYDEEQLVIIDEAHRYRNEDTYDYQLLHKLCINKKVILLTATPFNNDPKDVFALIKLFDVPSQSRISTVENLSMEFRDLIAEYKRMRRGLRKLDEKDIKERTARIAEKMRRMVGSVVIRRSRLDLDRIDRYRMDLKTQGYEFSKVLPPELQNYDLGPLADLYFSTLEQITDQKSGFTAARYQPANYVEDDKQLKEITKVYFNDSEDLRQAQRNLAKFMRRFLVMRFESSIAAFQETLKNFIAGHETMISWWDKFGYVPVYKKGKIPDPDSLESAISIDEIADEFSDNDLQKILSNNQITRDVEKGLILIPKSIMGNRYIDDLRKDLALLKSLYDKWFEDGSIKSDPKIEDLKRHIKELLTENPKRKLIIFTAYSDTARYINDKLSGEYRSFLYTGDLATSENKGTIAKNFDAGLPEDKQSDDYDVLVATDAISEGYNLHRAGVVINYDIPYNPVRVVQRIGRINRINKKVFNELRILNCFPTAIGENEVQTKKISGLKVHLMNTLIGTDTQVLTNEEQLESFFVDKVAEEQSKEEQESWDSKYRNFWDKVRFDHNLMKPVDDIKQRSFLGRRSENKGLILFGQKGEGIPTYVVSIDPDEPKRTSAEEALQLFEASQDEQPVKRTPKFQELYENSKNKLFKQSILPDKKGRRGDAINLLDLLAEKLPAARIYCKDARTIIADLDGFPEGTLKRIYDLGKDYMRHEDYEGAYHELQEIASVDYMEALQSRVAELSSEKETLLIAEELV